MYVILENEKEENKFETTLFPLLRIQFCCSGFECTFSFLKYTKILHLKSDRKHSNKLINFI